MGYWEGKRAPAIHRRDYDGTRGQGGVMLYNLPRWIPFAPQTIQEGPFRGTAVISSRREMEEFAAAWNDSEYVERYGKLVWNDSEHFDR